MSKTNTNIQFKRIDFGDIVYIKIKNDFFYSNGFYDPSVDLIAGDEENFKKISFRNCLFRIIPYLPKVLKNKNFSTETSQSEKSVQSKITFYRIIHSFVS